MGRAPFQLEAALRLMGCAEMAGSARRCLDLAVDHLKTRTQFGQVIGKNQALRHMAASDALACDTMEISVEYAAWAMDAAHGNAPAAAAEAAQALSAARPGIADQARTVAEHSAQLHGGICFTWEYGLHLHFRRIARLASHFGGVVAEQERLAQAALADCGLGAPPGRPAQAVPHLTEMGAN